MLQKRSSILNTIDTTSQTTGALLVAGGVGILGSLHAAGLWANGGGGVVSGNGTNTGRIIFGSPANGKNMYWNGTTLNIAGMPISIDGGTVKPGFYVTLSGAILAQGSVGALGFEDRINPAKYFVWYSSGDIARSYSGTRGIVLSASGVDGAGNVPGR